MLFVLVTVAGVAAGWVAYELDLIRQRREFIGAVQIALVAENKWDEATDAELSKEKSQPISWVRRVLGDHGYGIVVLPEKYDQHLIDRANTLFPEAKVFRWGGHSADPYGGESEFTIDVTKHTENDRRCDDYKSLQTPANLRGLGNKSFSIKDNRRISIRDESVEKAR